VDQKTNIHHIKGPRTKKNKYILSIFLKQRNFLITLIVISSTSFLWTWRNLHLKSKIYEKP